MPHIEHRAEDGRVAQIRCKEYSIVWISEHKTRAWTKSDASTESTPQNVRLWKFIDSGSIMLKSTLLYGRLILQDLHHKSTV